MNGFLAQLAVLARSRDNEDGGWMQLLIFIVVGVFYALATLAKAKAGKIEPKEDKTLEEAFAAKHRRQQPKMVRMDRVPARPKPAERRPAVKKAAYPAPAAAKKVSKRQPLTKPPSSPAEMIVERPVINFGDPKSLREAILHYEILGKPIALRNTGEHLSGL